jgi:hypothetical protein
MTMVNTDCDKCGCRDIFLRKKNSATGIYCDGCGRWYKWVGKKDIEQYTRRGFRVFTEDYTPPHLLHNAVPAQSNHVHLTNLGVPFGQDDAGVIAEEFVPTLSSVQRRTPEYHQPVPENISNFDPCPVCASGVIDPLSKTSDVSLIIFDKVMTIRTKDNRTEHGSYKIKHCPECGVKL